MSTKVKEKQEREPMTYTILYSENGVNTQIGCSKYSLTRFIEELSSQGAENIVALPNKTSKTINKNIVEIRKYYSSIYNHYYRKYKLNKIDQDTFDKIVITLRSLKKTSKTKAEFEKSFEEYKKTLTVIGK